MIVIPTATWTHTVFDLAAWSSAAVHGRMLYRWRLHAASLRVALATGVFLANFLGPGVVGTGFVRCSLRPVSP